MASYRAPPDHTLGLIVFAEQLKSRPGAGFVASGHCCDAAAAPHAQHFAKVAVFDPRAA
jgi:hypothetical protein